MKDMIYLIQNILQGVIMHIKYSMDIISGHPDFRNKILKKYSVDGIETIGAWGNEPFEIRFKNHTSNKVQVKISVDGTDVLTGKPATTDVDKNMWVVSGYGSLSLKAWPETNNGGAEFVFTSADKSVSLHTHGDLSCRGIIAAAVYEEDHVEPYRLDYYKGISFDNRPGGSDLCSGGVTYHNGGRIGRRSKSSVDYLSLHDADSSISSSVSCNNSKSLESLVAVGAGAHVDQKITYTSGLIKPKFAESVRVRYLWWDDLVSELKNQKSYDPHPSGFPVDKEHKIMSIGSTPRVTRIKKQNNTSTQSAFSRF